MKLKEIKYFLLVLMAIGIILIGISIYSAIFERIELELKLNMVSMLAGFSYLIFALVIWNLYSTKLK